MRKLSTLPIGSVSHGTLRDEDLIPEFLDLANSLRLSRAHRATVREIARDSTRENPDYWESGDASEDCDALIDLLNHYTPALCYFGSHPGDGADFGVWLSEDWETADLARIAAGDPFPRVSETTAEYLAVVSDHGNVTLYRPAGRRWVECWSVV